MYSILRYLYSLTITLLLPLIFLRLYVRSLKLPAYRKRWAERLGCTPKAPAANGIWLHAVSVGEVVAALPLINALLANYPQLPITVTTTTPTGSQRLTQSLANKVTHMYMPYDLSWPLQHLFAKIKPRILIIMETELWPNLLYTSQQQQVPVIIVNGRISDKSLRGYGRIKTLVAAMLQQVTMIFAQSQQDADRFKILGADPARLDVSGNLKFDVQIPAAQQQSGIALKSSLQPRPVWVAASTHNGEEIIILETFKLLQQQVPDLLLVLVPRHPDRFNEVATLIEQNNLAYVRRTQNIPCGAEIAILLGDTMGELNVFYAAADIAFVGGSLIPIGGHNLLEPAAAGVAILTGPHITNFQEITEKLLENNAVIITKDKQQLYEQMLTWLQDPSQRSQYGKRALAVVAQNRGATTKVIAKLSTYLDQSQALA